LYNEDIQQMALVLQMGENEVEKIKEPLMLWDEESKKFKKNFKIEYSAYLTDYSYESENGTKQFTRPDEYAEIAGKLAGRINRVVTRILDGKKLTKNNEEAIQDVTKFHPLAGEVVELLTKGTI